MSRDGANNQTTREMKLLLQQQLAQAGAVARTLRKPAGADLKLTGELKSFQPWLDKVWQMARKR